MSSVESAKSGFFPNNAANKTYAKKSNSIDQTPALKRNDPARKAELENTSGADAKVAINDGVKDFSRIKKAVDAAPLPDNSAKIAALKKQIADGTYKVDYDGLADKMLASEF